jgi:hypothetical protein
VEANLAELGAWLDAWNAHQLARAQAIAATDSRDRAVRALDLWMAQFRAVVRYAARDQPTLLHQLNIA